MIVRADKMEEMMEMVKKADTAMVPTVHVIKGNPGDGKVNALLEYARKHDWNAKVFDMSALDGCDDGPIMQKYVDHRLDAVFADKTKPMMIIIDELRNISIVNRKFLAMFVSKLFAMYSNEPEKICKDVHVFIPLNNEKINLNEYVDDAILTKIAIYRYNYEPPRFDSESSKNDFYKDIVEKDDMDRVMSVLLDCKKHLFDDYIPDIPELESDKKTFELPRKVADYLIKTAAEACDLYASDILTDIRLIKEAIFDVPLREKNIMIGMRSCGTDGLGYFTYRVKEGLKDGIYDKLIVVSVRPGRHGYGCELSVYDCKEALPLFIEALSA